MAELGTALADEQLLVGAQRRPRAPGPGAPAAPARARTAVLGWGALGLTGTALSALAAPELTRAPGVGWWFATPLGAGHAAATVGLYLGMALLAAAWVGLGRVVGQGGVGTRQLYVLGALWALPLFLGPALFSRDVYSYLALGTLTHLGLNPYQVAPNALGPLGHQHVLDAVSPFWRDSTAPYGPLFVGLTALVVKATGAGLVAGVLGIRLLDLIGLTIAAAFLPRLARALGSDPARAIWLALLSPLVMLQLVGAAHNDALMAGLLVAGVTVALEGRPALGIALCLAAATIKLPAAVGALFIAAAWVRTLPGARERLVFLTQCTLAGLATLGAISLLSGLGVSWLSSSAFSTPAKVHLAITPATALGWSAGSLLHDVHLAVSVRGIEDHLTTVATALVAVTVLILLRRVRVGNLVTCLALALLLAAAGGPAAWPWYLIWGVVLLAALPVPQRSFVLPSGLLATAFLVKANGILALPLHSAPYVLCVYAGALLAMWAHRRRVARW